MEYIFTTVGMLVCGRLFIGSIFNIVFVRVAAIVLSSYTVESVPVPFHEVEKFKLRHLPPTEVTALLFIGDRITVRL